MVGRVREFGALGRLLQDVVVAAGGEVLLGHCEWLVEQLVGELALWLRVVSVDFQGVDHVVEVDVVV